MPRFALNALANKLLRYVVNVEAGAYLHKINAS